MPMQERWWWHIAGAQPVRADIRCRRNRSAGGYRNMRRMKRGKQARAHWASRCVNVGW